jgi:Protein of unknown function (DUF1566)
MQMSRRMWEAVLMVAVMAWMSWATEHVWAQRARVPQTGQTACWDVAGNPINCDGTGQDGDIQAGVELPTPRFRVNGNGTVRDNLTGLIWLQDANYDALGPNGNGTVTWQQALDAANALVNGRCGLTDGSEPGDWRLPNVRELLSLLDYRFFSPGLSNAAGTAQGTEGDPFFGIQSAEIYWTSNPMQNSRGRAWFVAMVVGITIDENMNIPHLMWPVRGGN